jgi:hypothetical protein
MRYTPRPLKSLYKMIERKLGPRWLSGYITFWITGWCFFLPLYGILWASGKIKVNGYQKAVETLKDGKTIIAANHPDGFSIFALTLIFWKRALFQPRFCFFNMPRPGLMPSILLPLMRCILVTKEREPLREIIRTLQATGNAVIFPEKTRTNFQEEGVVYISNRRRTGICARPPRVCPQLRSAPERRFFPFGSICLMSRASPAFGKASSICTKKEDES